MGKKQRLDNLDQIIEQRNAQWAAAEQFELKVKSECSHKKTTSDGRVKLSIEAIDKHGTYRCKRCGDTFNLTSIPEQGKGGLTEALSTVHNAIQQIRCFSDVRNEKDRKLSLELGSVDAVLARLPVVYNRTVTAYNTNRKKKNKKNKGKKQNKGGFGSYSTQLNSRYNG